MPRNPLNNPTERILRLLDDLDHAVAYIAELEQVVEIGLGQVALAALSPAKPHFVAYLVETERQKHTHGAVMKARAYMARVRSASELGDAATSFRHIAQNMPGLSGSRRNEIDRLVEELGRDLATQNLIAETEVEPDGAAGQDILDNIAAGKGLFK